MEEKVLKLEQHSANRFIGVLKMIAANVPPWSIPNIEYLMDMKLKAQDIIQDGQRPSGAYEQDASI